MNKELSKALRRIAKVCRETVEACKDYDPQWMAYGKPTGPMKGAKSEARGCVDTANEILLEIKCIRCDARKEKANAS